MEDVPQKICFTAPQSQGSFWGCSCCSFKDTEQPIGHLVTNEVPQKRQKKKLFTLLVSMC
jgi:hypothetical protein